MEQLICRDLCLGYDGKTVAEHITFTVQKGDYLCIVGENGSGKSTLIKALLHLKKPLAGQILYEKGLTQNKIGYLPQQTAIQRDFPASVLEIVLSGCLNQGGLGPFYTKAQKQLAARNMEKMGISDLANRCYRELSGGQQQRVLLTRALCAAEDLLLLDEPATGLDPQVTAELYDVIARLHQEGMTVIMVSHDVHAAVQYANRILHLSKEPLFFGKTQDYLNSPVGQAFLQKGGADRE